jgi:transposase
VISAADRDCLEAVVADRNRPQKHVARARLVLLSAERLGVAAVARGAQISRPAVWRWQQRYAEAGVEGLLRDKTRKPGKASLDKAKVQQVVALTCAEPPGEATHWTGRMMAEAAGVSLRAVQRIWAALEAAAAPAAQLQALARPRLRRQARGDRRPLHGPAAARRGSLAR